MAHFAELNSSNEVLRVIVVSNDDVNANGGDLHADAETFVTTIVPHGTGGVAWKQTSYNNNFRRRYSAIGNTYNSELDMFILPKPYASWSLASDGDWKAPVTYPNDLEENSLTVFTSWDEDNNELITLLVSANGMDFIEKHVTTDYGKERCDYSAAISIEQLNMLYKKIKLLENLYGDGSMQLNKAEEDYSKYGPMKMAAIAKHNLVKGSKLTMGDVHFCRTSQSTGISQIDLLQVIGNKLVEDVKINQVIDWNHIRER